MAVLCASEAPHQLNTFGAQAQGSIQTSSPIVGTPAKLFRHCQRESAIAFFIK